MIRNLIEEQVQNVPVGTRIHLDKELLEELMFDVYDGPIRNLFEEEMNGKNMKIKNVVWSGEFLSKIDLSEVSFEDVLWDGYVIEGFEIDKTLYNSAQIELSNTNANIDLAKSAEAKSDCDVANIGLVNCNFANVDLSNFTLSAAARILNCDLSNTGLKFNNKELSALEMECSNLSGLDLSQSTVDENFLCAYMIDKEVPLDNYFYYIWYYNKCNFSNTGLKINVMPISGEECLNYLKVNDLKFDFTLNSDERKLAKKIGKIKDRVEKVLAVIEGINSGNLDGCYINGVLIKTYEDRINAIEQLLGEYKKFISNQRLI